MGVAGLTIIGATSSIVVSLASWAGVATATALGFIVSLATTIVMGVQKVAEKICEWSGFCP
ncbi:MAG: heme/copper-type cytochrome/quinol oxidase subunit 3 [Candidatus Azotimanducaceae bacterium]|jgi:heme/copper-type cytochrome/quinol oxidase subunit 3